MFNYKWKEDIAQWTKNAKAPKHFTTDLIALFEKAFENTCYPEKVLFGTTASKDRVIIAVGNIYLVAFYNQKIDILVDRHIEGINNVRYPIPKSTKNFEDPLYWLVSTNLRTINTLTQNQELWESYHRATHRIFENRAITAFKENIAKNKIPLSDFWNKGISDTSFITRQEVDRELEMGIENAKNLSRYNRLEYLQKSKPKPEKVAVMQFVFKRNPVVIIEVLDRAKGICENCKKPAPFIRDTDQTPYLEVHHIVPLANDGDDMIENAIALCPNCHRHAHHGAMSYS